jgi:hypothetical protein
LIYFNLYTYTLEYITDMTGKCQEDNCNISAIYNFKGESKKLYCNKHKKHGMINVKDRRCSSLECSKIPQFNFKNEKKGLYCSIHKKDGMVNVRDRVCQEKGCNTLATYNVSGETIKLYCVKHKKDNMIDIKHKTCMEENCRTRPIYNYDGEKNGVYCLKHRKDNMVNVKDKRCVYDNCKTIPYYNFKGEYTGIYCDMHKLDNMIDVMSKRCKTPMCDTFITNKYEGYCVSCFIHMFPNRPNSHNYKTKEKHVVQTITSEFPNLTWRDDKRIQDSCSNRRPDLLLDLGYQIIIIEIDENQHRSYDCSCENKRLMELSQDVGHRPIIFIRFNPDDYRIKNENIKSCWGYDKRGFACIKKSKQKEWNERLECLKKQIEYWIHLENKTDKMIEVIQLYYDT